MQMLINTKTVILTSFILNFFLVLLLVIYQLNQRTEKSTRMFTRAKVFQVMAFTVLALYIFTPSPYIVSWSQFAGSGLLMAAIFFECLAVLLLINSYSRRIFNIYVVFLIAFSTLYILVYYLGTAQNFRIVLFSVFASALFAYPLVMLFRRKAELRMQRVAGVIYLLIMACFIFRGLVSGNIVTRDIFLQGRLQSWILFDLFVLMILSNCGYLFLTKVRADKKLVQLANCDELTNILNRRAFNEISEKAISYCSRKNEPVGFMIFDVDNFKKVNDTFGHFVGDTVLETVASMVQTQIRAYDFFGRYGGDEFALFLPGTSVEDASLVAQRLLTTVESRTIYNHTKLRVTISIGMVSVVPASDTSMETLYQLADGALYDAKLEGGNCMMQPVQTIREGATDG